jgi:tetratricopeptide (TPR) repeat protein
MIRDFQLFLGPARLRLLIVLLGLTGLLSLILNAVGAEADWVPGVQSALVLVFVGGAVLIVGTRMDHATRLRWLAILAPVLGALLLAATVGRDFALPLLGAAVGWIVAGAFVFRPRIPREIQISVKHMRKGDYEAAIKALSDLIKRDPENENHYRLRAEIFRLWGKLDRARKDYAQITEIAPQSAVGFNGLAEVYMQSGEFAQAQEAALKAFELVPDEWVAAYNLGMIEDRLGEAQAAVEHLQIALRHKIPDARHRLLIHLYLARAYSRLGQTAAAQEQIVLLKRQRSGLEEWQTLLRHEEAAPLRAVLEDDVRLAQELVEGKVEDL